MEGSGWRERRPQRILAEHGLQTPASGAWTRERDHERGGLLGHAATWGLGGCRAVFHSSRPLQVRSGNDFPYLNLNKF